MANYFASARTRALLAGQIAPARDTPIPFTPEDWAHSQRGRECLDGAAHVLRWRVTVVPRDHRPRYFFLKGTLAAVTARAHQIFAEETQVLAIEAAPGLGESFDARLSLSF